MWLRDEMARADLDRDYYELGWNSGYDADDCEAWWFVA